MTNRFRPLTAAALCVLLLASCRKEGFDEEIIPSTWTKVTEGTPDSQIKGFFLLNEGNMGSNKASLDYFDYQTGYYMKNIYAERNPNVVKELGDVGNDLQIYGNKLYAVINCSNLVEVMNLRTARHEALVSIPNCRYIVFHEGYAYVSSYAGKVDIDPNARLGYVAKIDTVDFKVVAECTVGYQPEEMVITANKLYVANSGGYRVPNYDTTVSVIDLNTFTETRKIDVAINLHRMELDPTGYIYVSSRGDNYTKPSRTFVIDPRTDTVEGEIASLPNTEMTLGGQYLYVYGTEKNYISGGTAITFAKVDTRTRTVVARNIITDGTEKNITMPYGIAVNPESGDLFMTDAKNFVTPGTLYCFNPDGTKKWAVETGDIPSRIIFTNKKLETIKH